MNLTRHPGDPLLAAAEARDAMHPGVFTCPSSTPLVDVARMMTRYRIHAIVVTNDELDAAGVWGVVTDLEGRASRRGLWAVGEVASTGVHGANRLASNSLLEGLVFADRAGRALADELRAETGGAEAGSESVDEQPPKDSARIDRGARVFVLQVRTEPGDAHCRCSFT